MTSISTTQDLLRLLREDPDFRDQVRSLLLTQELIDLPERFAQFEAYVEQRFNSIENDLVTMKGDIAIIKGDLGRLKGLEYERGVSGSFISYASMAFRQRFGRSLRRNRLLRGKSQGTGEAFDDMISGAVERGLISGDEKVDLERADAVMSGQDGGATVYFVGEFSVTVNNTDIDRAIARAAILSKATGSDAWPMVIGETVPGPQRSRAEAERVEFREIEW